MPVTETRSEEIRLAVYGDFFLTDEMLRVDYLRSCPTYQRYDAMKLVREAAALLAEPGDKVIYRDAFRWKDHATDNVLCNHYEMQSLEYLAESFGYQIKHHFEHVAVVR